MSNCAYPSSAIQLATLLTLSFVGHATAQDTLYEMTGDQKNDGFGAVVDVAGDVDGDGVVDLIVGAPKYGGTGTYARVFSGKTGKLLHSVVAGSGEPYAFANAVAGLGDVNGDGRSEFAVAALNAGRKGKVIIYSGKDGSRLKEILSEI